MADIFRVSFYPIPSVLVLEGEFDLASHLHLSSRLADGERSPAQVLRIDVQGVRFVDCGSLGTIETTRRRLEETGRTMLITGASARFRRITGLAGYAELLAAATPAVPASQHGPGSWR